MKWFGLVVTIIAYLLARKFYQRFPYPFFVPVLIATVIIISVLFFTQYPYEQYLKDVSLITELLGVAIVALGYPLYKQWKVIQKYMIPILFGTFIGTYLGLESGRMLAKWFQFDNSVTYSLIVKSVTTPVAIEITEEIGGSARWRRYL